MMALLSRLSPDLKPEQCQLYNMSSLGRQTLEVRFLRDL